MYNLRKKQSRTTTEDEPQPPLEQSTQTNQEQLATQSTTDTNTTTQINDNIDNIIYSNDENVPEEIGFLGFNISANTSDASEIDDENNRAAILEQQQETDAEQKGESKEEGDVRHHYVTKTDQLGNRTFPTSLVAADPIHPHTELVQERSDESAAQINPIHFSNESHSNVASTQPAASAHVATAPDLLAQIAILMKTNLDELKSETNTRLSKLESNIKADIKSENNTRFKTLSDEIKIQIKQTNDNLNQLSQHIETKLTEVENKYEQVNSKLNTIETIQIKQSEKIDSIEIKFNKDLGKQIESIREDLIKDFESQHDTIKETIQTNNSEIIHIVDTKLNNQSVICQTNLLQQNNELMIKIDKSKQDILNQILPNSQIQTEKIKSLHDLVNTQDIRLNKVEEKINQQPQTSIPNIYVTCTGGRNNQLGDNNPPKFYGRASNPKEFLAKLKRFYERSITNKDMHDDTQHLHDIIDQCFDHHAAKWFELCKININTWNDFEKAFLNKYWSRDIQRGIKHRIETERYRPGGKLTRAEYFIERVLTLRSITPPLTDEEIVTVLAEHFSELIQDARRVQNVHDVTGFELLLQREDLKDAQQRARTSDQPRNEQQHRPAPNYNNHHQQSSNSPPRSSYPPRNNNNHQYNNYQNRPSYQNYSNRRDNQQQRSDHRNNYQQGQQWNGNSYNQPGSYKREERSYPTKEQRQVCSTMVERSNSSQNNSTSPSPTALNC